MAYVALITGASSGIGEATARRLAREPDVKLVLVARRADRLEALASELGGATVIPIDLTSEDAPALVREVIEREHAGEIHMLVNNAGAAWRGKFGEKGWANIERHMKLNFEAPVRLTEALLPLLRTTATRSADHRRVCIVNVASTASRVSRPGSGAYSASKFALVGWNDALALEEIEHGVHVGMVLPGFIRTEGFPAAELPGFMVSEAPVVADAIFETGPGGKFERYVPRPYWVPAMLRIVAPRLVRRALERGGFTTATSAKE